MTPPLPHAGEGLNAAVAAELRAERAAAQVTIEELAAKADISEVSLRRYLKAQRHIDISVLAALAGALGTTARAIIDSAESRMTREQGNEGSGTITRLPLPPKTPATPQTRAARSPKRKPKMGEE